VWVLMSRSAERFRDPAAQTGQPIAVPPGQPLWTDDYSNLFQCLLAR